MNKQKAKQFKHTLRKNRTRAKIYGTPEVPRLCVTRTLRQIGAQIIDDTIGKTLVAVSSKHLDVKGSKTDIAGAVGKKIAELAKEKKIERVVFDRKGRKYHGRVKALAEAAREHGLVF